MSLRQRRQFIGRDPFGLSLSKPRPALGQAQGKRYKLSSIRAWRPGTIAVGSTQHLWAELFKSMAGIDALVVPYKGSPAVLAAQRAGQLGGQDRAGLRPAARTAQPLRAPCASANRAHTVGS